jgi:hypothetical protein
VAIRSLDCGTLAIEILRCDQEMRPRRAKLRPRQCKRFAVARNVVCRGLALPRLKRELLIELGQLAFDLGITPPRPIRLLGELQVLELQAMTCLACFLEVLTGSVQVLAVGAQRTLGSVTGAASVGKGSVPVCRRRTQMFDFALTA